MNENKSIKIHENQIVLHSIKDEISICSEFNENKHGKENVSNKNRKNVNIDHRQIQEFLKYSGKLKRERRHSWPEGLSGPKESVADHSYQLILMVILYHDKLDKEVDLVKCIYMAALHDLPESITGDIPLTEQTDRIKEIKKKNEMNAMETICSVLGKELGVSFFDLYKEYEENKSYEAKFVRALDKIEAFQQHNQDPLETWILKEKEMVFQDKYMIDFCKFDSCMISLAQKVIQDSIDKLIKGREDINELKKGSLLSNNS